MPRKPVDTSKGLVPMVRNPETGRYVRVNSKIGRGLLMKYEPQQEMRQEQPEIHEKVEKKARGIQRRTRQQTHVEFKEPEKAQSMPKHPVELDEIARQIEMLRQRLVDHVEFTPE